MIAKLTMKLGKVVKKKVGKRLTKQRGRNLEKN